MINVSSQERERSCICVLGHMCARTPSLSLSTTCPFDFGIVPTVWYILFSFYHSNTALTENLTIKKKGKKSCKI